MFANDDARRPSDQFTSKELHLRAYANGITLDFSRSGKPTDNAYVETFNATVRLLGRHWFLDPGGDREKVEEWPTGYNEVTHGAIADRTPLSLISTSRLTPRPEILS